MVEKKFEPGELVYVVIPEVWGGSNFLKARYEFKNPGGHTVSLIDPYLHFVGDRIGGGNSKESSFYSITVLEDGTQKADVSDHHILPDGELSVLKVLYGKRSKKA